MKNLFNKITIIMLGFAVLFTLVACGETTEGEVIITDVIERPSDIPPLPELDNVSYPAKPEGVFNKGDGIPTLGEAVSYGDYEITQEDGVISASYYEIGKWDYIYIPIEGYNEEYPNMKITVNATNVFKVAFQVVYYEMYDNNEAPVTACLSDVGDGSQFFILEFSKCKLLDQKYDPTDKKLSEQTIIGLCVFIDSNPSQPITYKKTDKLSTFEITGVEYLKDGDPSLGDRYVAPTLSEGAYDSGYNLVKDYDNNSYEITKYASAGQWESATIAINNFSSQYSAFNMKVNTTGVKNMSIELQFAGGLSNWSDRVGVYNAANLTDGEHEIYIDFTFTSPIDMDNMWTPAAGYYIKNYKVTGIIIYLDTATENVNDLIDKDATCVISEVVFDRVSNDSTVISKGWNPGDPSITLGDDITTGGVGSISYIHHDTWGYLAMPVMNYETANKLTVQIQAEDGIGCFGIALGVAELAEGFNVIKSCHSNISVAEGKVGVFEGIVETVEYDETTKIYTISFDFTNAVKVTEFGGKSVNELIITSLNFYFTDDTNSDYFEGSRTIRFVSISFE